VAPDGDWLLASRCTGAPECHVATVALPSGDENHITEASNVTPFSNSGAIALDNQTLAYVAITRSILAPTTPTSCSPTAMDPIRV